MNILISFIPWFAFWIFISLGKLFPGALCGFLGALFINTIGVKKRKVKVLELGTLVYFLGLSATALYIDSHILERWVDLSGDLALFLIVLFSIVIKKPFTLQYAREETPREQWNIPEFLRANYVITWVWTGAFAVNTSFAAYRAAFQHIGIWIDWAMSLSCFGAAISFTHYYKKRLREKSAKEFRPHSK